MRIVAPKLQSLTWGWLVLTYILASGFAGGSAFASGLENGKAAPATQQPAVITKQEPNILVVGDSLSAAYNISRESGWVSLLRQRLQQALPGVTVVNGSVSGATTAAGLQVLPELLEEHQPDLVILELGANDGLQGKPIGHITSNLRELIEMSLDSGAHVILAGVHLPPNYGRGYTEPFFQMYADLAQEYGLGYIPFILEGVADRAELMQQDGLHPTAEAQEQILENVWPAIAEAIAGVELMQKADLVRRSTPIAAR